jgi:hypothetical protein
VARPPRYLPYPGCLVEVTAMTIQGRLLLRPDPEVTQTVLGVLGKGLEANPNANLVAYQYMSDQPHLIFAPESVEALAKYMCFVQTNISKEVGTRLRDWPGPFWHRRYEATPILDDRAAVARLRHLLENSVKENLVETIEDWPGANSARAMLTGVPDVGAWIDRTAQLEAHRLKDGDKVDPAVFIEQVSVPLVPLPCWAHLSPEEQTQNVRNLLDGIRAEHAARRAATRVTVLGVEGVLAVDPYECSSTGGQPGVKDGAPPAPPVACHTSSTRLYDQYCKVFAALLDDYYAASKAFRGGERDVEFPEGTFRPLGGFTPWTRGSPSGPLDWAGGQSLA